MKSPVLAILATALVVTAASAAPPQAKPAVARKTAPKAPETASPVAHANELISDYCSSCHHDGKKSGGVSLETFDMAKVTSDPDLGERMIKKLRTGLMPPPNAKRPEPAEAKLMVESMEQRLDRASALKPNPGFRPFQRLNRPEYARSVKDLLAIEVDVNAFLPPDTMAHGFDNVADAQTFSPTLMEGYLRAASKVSALAIGDRNASPTETTYKTDRTAAQLERVEGAPLGTRGGLSVVHNFPADGDYSFRMMLHSIPTGQLFGSTVKGEQIEVSIDGARVSLLPINTRMSEMDPNGMNLQTLRVYVTAGPHRVSAAFIQKFEAPVDDLLTPIDYTLADTQIGAGYGITALPHLRDFAITGPLKVTGISDTPSRRRVFVCRPTLPAEETGCAREIVQNLTFTAYRGNVSEKDVAGLMALYEKGRAQDGFEAGVKMALQAVLASPKFLFRIEETPALIKAGEIYRIGDLELASRLSFFLWGGGPDAELLKAAKSQTLSNPVVLEKQVRRMLLDPRAEALSTRFASQWLRLQDLEKIRPDALLYPYYDAILADGLRRETQLLFDSIVREDRSVLDILNADYTFVNERVARHYGIPNVTGTQFRRVDLKGTPRRGVLGQGSILALTSVADRTSPVQRGKWILEVLLNSAPPPPPPTVPALEDTKGVTEEGKVLTVRQRLEEHRKNPACTSCHRVIDPLGLALENFDVDGRWRIKDSGAAIDAVGKLYDGTPLDGPEALRKALLAHSEGVLRGFTEYLMTYALGRRIEPADGPTRAIVRDASKNGYRFSSFALGVVKSAPFTRGRAQEAPAQRQADIVAEAKAKALRPVSETGFRARFSTVREGKRPSAAEGARVMFIKKTHISRRTVLRGLGATVALPFLDAMIPARTAFAKTGLGKIRLSAIEMVHGSAGSTAIGIEKNLWAPAAVGRDFDLSPSSLMPLTPYKDQLTIVSNTDVRNAEAFNPPEIGGDHFRSSATFLTQTHVKQTQGSDILAGTSLDQLYAQRVGQETAIPSMQLSIENVDQAGGCAYGYACVYTDTISWAAPDKPLPMIRDPRAAFDQLFGVGATPAERAALRNADKSILDWITVEASRLKKTLGPTDQARLSDYLDNIREIERRIQKVEAFNKSGEVREIPEAPVGVPDSFREHVRLMFDLQVVAFASDVTRVFSFKMARDGSSRAYPESGHSGPFHPTSHHQDKEDKIRDFAKINQYHVGMLPYFLDKLKATPDGEGNLLENTMILYGSPMGNSNLHNHRRCPLILLGHAGGQLKGGLHLKAKDETPMANVMLSMLHSLGLDDMKSFGDSTAPFDLNAVSA